MPLYNSLYSREAGEYFRILHDLRWERFSCRLSSSSPFQWEIGWGLISRRIYPLQLPLGKGERMKLALMPDVLGVEGLGPVDVAGAFDNGPAIREYGEIVAIGGEAEHELVVRHFALGDAF